MIFGRQNLQDMIMKIFSPLPFAYLFCGDTKFMNTLCITQSGVHQINKSVLYFKLAHFRGLVTDQIQEKKNKTHYSTSHCFGR